MCLAGSVTHRLKRAVAGKRANRCRGFPSRVCGLFLPARGHRALDLKQLAAALTSMGGPPEKCEEMAAQLHKRAKQLAGQKQTTYEAAMEHLLRLMSQGWAAKDRGIQ